MAKAVGRGERVLCLFAGCGAEALILAAQTACARVVAVEANPAAVRCLRRSALTSRPARGPSARAEDAPRRLQRRGAAGDKLEIVEADVLADLAAIRGVRCTLANRRASRDSLQLSPPPTLSRIG